MSLVSMIKRTSAWITDQVSQALAIVGAMGVICFYMIAVLDTDWAIVGGMIAMKCMWLCNRGSDSQRKKVNFRVKTVLAGAHVALIPAIVFAWIKRTESFDLEKITLTEVLTSIAPISFIMVIGALIGLEVREQSKEYADRNKTRPRFYKRFDADRVRSKSLKKRE